MNHLNHASVTDDQLELAERRYALSTDIAAYSLPELTEPWAATISERILGSERLASPDLSVAGYREGSAIHQNELTAQSGIRPILLTSEHSTDHRRYNKQEGQETDKPADWGTGGLGIVLATDLSAHHVTTRGRQTGNPNSNPTHPFKDRMAGILERFKIDRTLAIHGMQRGYVADLADERAIDIMLGIGETATDATKTRAEQIRAIGKDLGLRVVTNQTFVSMDSHVPPVPRLRDGQVFYNRFAAAGLGTTRAFAQAWSEQNGQPLIPIQVELSSFLRYNPETSGDKKRQQMGMYLGYLFLMKSLSL